MVARVGDEIEFLKGKKAAFSPFSALPDQIKNIIHKELPFVWILLFLLLFSILAFTGFRFMLSQQETTALANFQNVISTPAEQANITVYLP